MDTKVKQYTTDSGFLLYINNIKYQLNNPSPKLKLVEFLREKRFTGTKVGCGNGSCGACTVVIASFDKVHATVQYQSGNACLLPLCKLNNCQVITVEGIGSPSFPHAIQERLALGFGSQCGFCSPGMVMSMYGVLKNKSCPEVPDIEDAISGNICRCTGYRSILDSFKTFTDVAPAFTAYLVDNDSSTDNSVVYSHNDPKLKQEGQAIKPKVVQRCDYGSMHKLVPYDADKDLKFPDELKSVDQTIGLIKVYSAKDTVWYTPNSLQQLLDLKDVYPDCALVAGNGELITESSESHRFADPCNVTELIKIDWIADRIVIGANVTLTHLKTIFTNKLSEIKEHQQSTLKAFLDGLSHFANLQVRNFGTVGGNILAASPNSDLVPILIATSTIAVIRSVNSLRKVPILELIAGYRKCSLEFTEVLVCLEVPLNQPNEVVRAFPHKKLKDDVIGVTNACFKLSYRINDPNFTVTAIEMVYGGLGPTVRTLKKAPGLFLGKSWLNDVTTNLIEEAVLDEIDIDEETYGGRPTYRRILAATLAKRFWKATCKQFKKEKLSSESSQTLIATTDTLPLPSSKDNNAFFAQPISNNIGVAHPHVASLNQTTGTAIFLDDMPKLEGELEAYPILSTEANATILNMEFSKAMQVEGVYGYVNYQDIAPGKNCFGPVEKDEEIFASGKVNNYGQLIALILASSRSIARKAAKLVEVTYSVEEPILNLEHAIDKGQFLPFELNLSNSESTDTSTTNTTHITTHTEEVLNFEGVCRSGGQEHFYLETQCCRIIPNGENGELTIFSSTQYLKAAQSAVAFLLDIPSNRIVVKAKRLGGGFGGKETRSLIFVLAASVATNKFGLPVRIVLDRVSDMVSTGNRHPYQLKYKLTTTADLRFQEVDLEFISNAGSSLDYSPYILGKTVTNCDNCYHFPKVKVRGRLVQTHNPSNTAFRGFGNPQSIFLVETMICQIAEKMGVNPNHIRNQNFYQLGQKTHTNTPLLDWYLPEIWSNLLQSDYLPLKAQSDQFNSTSTTKRQGVSILPTKFGIAYEVNFLNQASALVHIYLDGTVLISHGGIEMGQGLNTKMLQVAANLLQVPFSQVYISESATDKISNATATSASVSSELYGAAVADACKQLNSRLESFRIQLNTTCMTTLASAAYFASVSLSALGFYRREAMQYDMTTNTGELYDYYVTGCAVSQVEIDLEDGTFTTLSTKIVMDLGHPINPGLDLGQVEGAFLQGLGWTTIEETLIDNTGKWVSRDSNSYQLPTVHHLPKKFEVVFLSGKEYKQKPLYGTAKAVGEPPFVLGSSVYFAIRDAISSTMPGTQVKLDAPATSESIRLALNDPLRNKSQVKVDPNCKPRFFRP